MGSVRVRSGDDGFGLIEVVVAATVLVIMIVVSIGPIMSAFGVLGNAKTTDVAYNLGQAHIEAIRSLEFDDVGVVSGSPDGVLAASETTEVQGVEVVIETSVRWVGSDSGLDIVDGGGDGVPGFFDPGIDYKLVEVTVSPVNGDPPVVFETIISPPNVAATEGASNIILQLSAVLPDGATSPASWPTVYLHHDGGYVFGSASSEQLFADLIPDRSYTVRLGPGVDDIESSDGAWALTDPDAEPLVVGAAQTITQVVQIYRPMVLDVAAQDLYGTPLTDAVLVVSDPDTALDHTFTAADFSAPAEARWTIGELDGVPLATGDYKLLVSAPGHVASEQVTVELPDPATPDETGRSEVFQLAPLGSTVVTVLVRDDAASSPEVINGANVHFTDDGGGSVTLTTGIDGTVVAALDDGAVHDIEISSPYGHETRTVTGIDPGALASTTIEVVLSPPPDTALFRFFHLGTFDGVYDFRPAGTSGDDWLEVKPNSTGDASVVVDDYDYLSGSVWEAQLRCDSGDVSVVKSLTYTQIVGGTVLDWGNEACP